MANSVGSLTVLLGLDAAEYTRGLTKAERDAQKFAQNTRAAILEVGKVLGGLEIVRQVMETTKAIIAEAAALDDLSDATGSSVESLSKLANQAKISGRDFGELQSIMLKLAAGMAGADDESSNTGRALAALGVTARDPAEALQQIAIALNKYADGVGKAAIARDLFGKQGPAFLATLKDIAESQDVVGTTTAKMAADAEALEKAWRRLTVEGTAFKDLILSGLVPWLNTMLEQFREGIKLAGGFGEALRTLGTINPFKSAAENIADANERLAALKAGTGAESFFAKMFGTTDEVNRRLELVKAFEQLRQRQQAMAGAAALGYTGDVRDYVAGRKPTLDYTGTKSKGAGAGKAEVDEFAKAMQRVRELTAAAGDDLAEAFSGEKILPAVKALDKLKESDVWRTLNAGQREALELSYASAASLEKEAEAWKKKREEQEKEIKVYQEIQDAQEKAQKAFRDTIGHYAEENDALKRQIGVLGEDDAARQKLAATLEYERLLKQGIAADDVKGIEILKQQYDERLKLIDAYNKTAEALRTTAEYNRIFTDSFSDALVSVVEGTKSVSQAFKDMARSITHDLNEIAARNLAKALFGVDDSGGGGLAALIAKYGPALVGAFAGSPDFGSYATGPGAPQLGGPGGGLAGGTDYWRGGPTWVGERGPEILNLPAGSQVIPSDKSRRMAGTTNVYNINVMPGASSASVRQTGDMLRDVTMRSMRSR